MARSRGYRLVAVAGETLDERTHLLRMYRARRYLLACGPWSKQARRDGHPTDSEEPGRLIDALQYGNEANDRAQ